jgi:hypothetical protein
VPLYLQRRSPRYPLEREGLGWPHSRRRCCGKEGNIPLPGIEPGPSRHELVVLLTELSQLLWSGLILYKTTQNLSITARIRLSKQFSEGERALRSVFINFYAIVISRSPPAYFAPLLYELSSKYGSAGLRELRGLIIQTCKFSSPSALLLDNKTSLCKFCKKSSKRL